MPRTSAGERSSRSDSWPDGSTLVGPPLAYTPVYVLCGSGQLLFRTLYTWDLKMSFEYQALAGMPRCHPAALATLGLLLGEHPVVQAGC